MKTLLTIIAILNLNTVDTHGVNYQPNSIQYDGLTYKIEEDYSVSINYIPHYIIKDGFSYLMEEDASLTLVK